MKKLYSIAYRKKTRSGFTLIEVLLASVAIGIIFLAVQGLFSRAVKLRDKGTAHVREATVRSRATGLIRSDLSNALISGGVIAGSLTSSARSPDGHFPGYLKFTTTCTPQPSEAVPCDVQEIEYFISADPLSTNQNSGILTRTINRNLLTSVQQSSQTNQILANVESMEVSLNDGVNWVSEWNHASGETNIPMAVRVRIQPTALPDQPKPAPVEILVPWSSQVFLTTSTVTTNGATP